MRTVVIAGGSDGLDKALATRLVSDGNHRYYQGRQVDHAMPIRRVDGLVNSIPEGTLGIYFDPREAHALQQARI